MCLTALLLGAFALGALSDEALLGRAETEFAEGVSLRESAHKARPHFRVAAACYAELRQRGARNPLLDRNLGNAYLLADDLPRAILAYRRGLRLAPGDAALQARLAEARALVAYPEESAFARPVDENGLAAWLILWPGWLFAGAVWADILGWALLTRWRMVRRGRALLGGLGALLAAGLLAGALFVVERTQADALARPLAVIARDGALVRKGNGTAYPARYATPLNRGVEARLLFRRGGWVQIELAGGEVGWVPGTAVVVDEPAA